MADMWPEVPRKPVKPKEKVCMYTVEYEGQLNGKVISRKVKHDHPGKPCRYG